jgi:FtsZ-binding cell division protein ZapB
LSNLRSSITYETFLKSTEVHRTWSDILPKAHHLVSADIRALEESCPEDIGFRYVNIYEDGQLIGLMYLQMLTFNHRHFDHQLLDRPIIRLFKPLILRQSTEVMVCGNLFRVDFQGFYFVDKARKEMVFNCLLEYRKTMNTPSRISGILVKDCSKEFDQIQFGCHSFRSFTQDLTMELSIHPKWQTFKDYTNDLSRKYRQRAAKIQSAAKDIQLIDLSLEELIQHKDEIETLYRNILRKQNLALGIINSEYFIRMKSLLGNDFKVFTYQLEGRILAFSSHIYYPKKECMENSLHRAGL